MPEGTSPTHKDHKPRLGLALGGGVGRGWAHIGVIKALTDAGLRPDIIAGTSIGAVVGGCFAAGKLPALEEWARGLTPLKVMRLLDFRVRQPSFISGKRLETRLREHLGDTKIEDLDTRFVALATDLLTGHEVWRNKGDLTDAIRASYALPGIFPPIPYRHRLLIDGVLVNPVPVSACRALGADVVIAVSLNADMQGQVRRLPDDAMEKIDAETSQNNGLTTEQFDDLPAWANMARRLFNGDKTQPSMTSVMFSTLQIVADRMSRARLAADPPDVLLAPPIDHISLIEFHRTDELIAIGQSALSDRVPDIHRALDHAGAIAERFS